MKRLISLIISVIMLISLGDITAFASNNKIGDNITFSYSESGVITISGSGCCYDNAEDIVNSAEKVRHEKALSDINDKYASREKEVKGKIAEIVVKGYYQGTDKEYQLEMSALSDDITNVREAINNTDDENEKARLNEQLTELNSRYNELTILKANRQHKDILENELGAMPEKKQSETESENKLNSDNSAYITKRLKELCDNCSPKPVTPSKPKVSATKIKNIKRGKRSFKLSWKKVSGASGYVIQYSTKNNFKKKKTVKIKKATKTAKTIKKLKVKKKYYVRVRAYKKINGKTQYSKWSAVKKVKVK